MTQTHRTAEAAAASKVDEAVVDAEKDTELPREAYEPIFGPLEDELFEKRIRRSFGSRAFWGTVVDAYVVGKGLFYKVSFDDGDVDILSVDEVKADMKAAELHAMEDTREKEPEAEDTGSLEKTGTYTDLMRSKKASLKRRRDGSSSEAANEPSKSVKTPWDVKLWSVRLFATIMEERGYMRIQSFIPMADGGKGELESSGTIQPGDALLAVQGRVVHGVMDHIQACDLIRGLPRPLTLTFIRPPSTGEILTIAAAKEMVKENTSAQSEDQNRDDKVEESPAKKTRTDEDATATTVSKPPIVQSAVSSPETRQDPPSRGNSRPPTPDFEIIQVVQPAAPSLPQPQQRHRQPSPYFARRPSPPKADVEYSQANSERKRTVGIRRHLHPQQVEPIPFRQPSPHQRQPSPHPPGAVQMPHSQSGERGYPVSSTYAGQNTVHQSQYATAPYNPRRQQPPAVYTSAPMVLVPPTATRPAFYISQPAPSSHYAQGAPGPDRSYRGVSGGSHAYTVSSGHQYAQPMRGVSSGYQPSMANPSAMPAAPPQPRSAVISRDRLLQSGGGGSAPFYPQNGVPYTAPHGTFATPQVLPRQHQPTSQQAMPPQTSALGVTPTLSERQEMPSSAPQAEPAMTLGDLVANLSQRQRERAANAQRLAGSMAPPPVLAAQSVTSAVASNGGGSAAPSPDKQQSSSSVQSASPAPTVEEQAHSFLSVEDDDEFASTGTSFLSVDDSSFLTDIPVPRKPISAHTDSIATLMRPTRPRYLNKYASDEIVEVQITMARLYLTLGVMGNHIVVSTFVRSQAGEMGEIEASGKVLTGDILLGVGSYECSRETTPSDVARIVGLMPRPYWAYFMRPSWDMLE